MPLAPVPFKPGINNEVSQVSAGQQWWDGNRVRFYRGQPTPIGDWQEIVQVSQYRGVTRKAISYTSLSGDNIMVFSTNKRLYAHEGGQNYNITPIREEDSLTDPFTTTNGSSEVSVNHAGHAVIIGDIVTFSNTTTLDGIDLDGDFDVVSVTDSSNYVIETNQNATGSTAGGGGTIDYIYEINTGGEDTDIYAGYGTGTYSTPPGWSESRTDSTFLRGLRLWSLTKWGEDTLANPRGGAIYWWQFNDTLDNRAEQLDTDSEAPNQCNFILTFAAARHIIAFGCNPLGETDLDPMLIRWSDQEDFNNTDSWEPQDTNLAGDFRLSEGTQIMGALQTLNNEILVWTDTSVYKMTYTGDDFVFGLQFLSRHTGLISPNAAVDVEGVVFFMSNSDFYIYDGRLRVLPCTVRSFVFDNMNERQSNKCFAASNANQQEVWFFYPDNDSDEINRYVSYNFVENHWSMGELDRTYWLDLSAISTDNPIAFSPDHRIYYHDIRNTAAPNNYIESGEFMADEGGDRVVFISRMIPDMERISGTCNLTVKYRQYPNQTQKSKGPFPINSNSDKIDMRVRGRQIAIRFSSNARVWRLSNLRADIRPDGQR